MSPLAAHCPRLYRAHQAARAFQRRRQAALLSARRCEAHRELQLVRAYATGNARYIRRRQDKLDAIRREIATLEATR